MKIILLLRNTIYILYKVNGLKEFIKLITISLLTTLLDIIFALTNESVNISSSIYKILFFILLYFILKVFTLN